MIASVLLALAATVWSTPASAAPPVILTNQLGYDLPGPKHAVVQGHAGDQVRSCRLADSATGHTVAQLNPQYAGPVRAWRDWVYWSIDFSGVRREGTFLVACDTSAGPVASFPFLIERNLLERHTLSNVLYYFKGQRASGAIDAADHALPLEDRTDTVVDAHGGWYDATGDYGKYLSHLSFASYFNPQQVPLTAWALLKTDELLERRRDPAFRQYLRRLIDEAAWGADYLVRVKVPGGSFYRSVSAPGPGKRPEDRRIGRDTQSFAILSTQGDSTQPAHVDATADAREYQSSLRAGGGMAIAALARAAAMHAPGELSGDYLRAAEDAWSFLADNNGRLTNDGRENIVDDYCALIAATELFSATLKGEYRAAADRRAHRLMHRLAESPRAYWKADDKNRPFFHAADAGLPAVSLLAYLDIADPSTRPEVLKAIRTSLEWEMSVTGEVVNPFGYARQLVQTRTGQRDTRFFYPHDADTAPWWQGEDARLLSLAFAARLAARQFAGDPLFCSRLARYAQNQIDWVLGLNPFDASLLQGTGRNNPEYHFFDSYEYTNAPGGIVNGITAAFSDADGIDFNVPHTVTGADHDWRWGEQWLPHATWYLLAVAAGSATPVVTSMTRPVVIAYVFTKNAIIDPAAIDADRLTHINYAFANIRDGEVVEGFEHDAENFQALTGLRREHPHLKVLVSVGGWTWSGGFSDAALTPESRARFVKSAVDFVGRYDLDGFDVDWEYPGQPGIGNTYRPEDKANFTALMADLRVALDKDGARRRRKYLLTFAAGASPSFIAQTELDKVQASVDFVNLMTYDFREAGGGATGHHANLFDNPADDRKRSADRAVTEFLAAGVPAEKLVLGVPFYGRAWADVEAQSHGLYQPGSRPAERIETGYGRMAGTLIGRDGFVRYWDAEARAPYLWNAERRIFISYDDPESLRLKGQYLRQHGLAGAMFWQYTDDPTGALLEALFDALHDEGLSESEITPGP
jgi:GH18 family chitinase